MFRKLKYLVNERYQTLLNIVTPSQSLSHLSSDHRTNLYVLSDYIGNQTCLMLFQVATLKDAVKSQPTNPKGGDAIFFFK